MRRAYAAIPAVLFLIAACLAQAPSTSVKVKVRAALFDRDLNLKPVPRLTITFRSLDAPSREPMVVQTTLDGVAELELQPGRYRLITEKPAEMVSKTFSWDMEVQVLKPENLIELSNDNARITDVTGGRGARVDELAEQFQRVKASVVTVWPEDYDCDGVVVDPAGLVLTSYRVVEGHAWIAVEFDEKHKVAAQVLAADQGKDLAVLRVNPEAMPGMAVAQLATDAGALIEGERAFTVRNSPRDGKTMLTGVISNVTKDTISTDAKLDDLGGPFFSSTGTVVGITRAVGRDLQLVPATMAVELLATAREKMKSTPPPSARLLPTPPPGYYPAEALRSRGATRFEKDVYAFKLGDFQVSLITPVHLYEENEEEYLAAVKEREKRVKKSQEPPPVVEPPHDRYKPVLTISVVPDTRMPFLKNFGRANTRMPMIYEFKTTFLKMRLLCGGKEVEPIWPRRISLAGPETRYAVVEGNTYVGSYDYLPDAISPSCGEVALEVVSAKEAKPIVKVIDPKVVARIRDDFEPYRKVQGASSRSN